MNIVFFALRGHVGSLTLTLVLLVAVVRPGLCAADDALMSRAIVTMQRATAFFHDRVAVRGGYVWEYSPDLTTRRGERKAAPTEIWVQPPGTPTVGAAFLDAHEATGDEMHLVATKRPRLEHLARRHARARSGDTIREPPDALKTLRRDAERIIDSLDAEGRWLATADGKPWPMDRADASRGERDPAGGPLISSALFARNLTRLAEFVTAARGAAGVEAAPSNSKR